MENNATRPARPSRLMLDLSDAVLRLERRVLTGLMTLLVLLIFVLRLHGALTEHHPALSFRDASFLQSFTIMAALVGMTLLVLGVLLMSEARLAKALVLSHTNYRLLVENASEGIVVAQSGRVQFANPMLLSWLGYTADDVLGQNLLQFVHEDDRAKVLESYNLRVQGLAQGLKYCGGKTFRRGEARPAELATHSLTEAGDV